MEGVCTKEESSIEAVLKDTNAVEDTQKLEEADGSSHPDFKDLDTAVDNDTPTPQQEVDCQEKMIKRKYGGLIKKKPPLISKDHERAFFDSADWALGKKTKGPVEALRPKLQPTPHQQARSRSAYAPADDGDDRGNSDNVNSLENQDIISDSTTTEKNRDRGLETQNHQN